MNWLPMDWLLVAGVWIVCLVALGGIYLVGMSRECRHRIEDDEWMTNGHSKNHKDREAA